MFKIGTLATWSRSRSQSRPKKWGLRNTGYQTLIVLANRISLREQPLPQLGQLHSTTAVGWSLHPGPQRVGRAPHHYCKLMPAGQIFLLQRSCQPSVASSVTLPCTEKYICGQDPVVLCACEFVNCTAESHIRTSVIGVVVKAFLLALHDKDKSFFINSRTHTQQQLGC